MTPDKQAVRALWRQVRAVLFDEWNPIGMEGRVPEDEYDACVGPVTAKVWRGESVDEIAAYLDRSATNYFGCPVPYEVNRSVAEKLLALKTTAELND